MAVDNQPNLFAGVLGLGSFYVIQTYEAVREGSTDLRDADILVGVITFAVSTASSYAMNSTWPYLFLFGSFLAISLWHHAIANRMEQR